MAIQMSSGLRGQRQAADTWNNYTFPIIAKVLEAQPEHGTVHLATAQGGFMRFVRVVGQGGGGTKNGLQDIPTVINIDPKKEREGFYKYEDYDKRFMRDTMALVLFIDGNVHKPVCMIMPPDFHHGSFPEQSQKTDRYSGDHYTHDYSLDAPTPDEIREKVKNDSGTFDDEDDPKAADYPRKSNHEEVYADRRRLKDPTKDPLDKKPPHFEPESDDGGDDAKYFLRPATYEKIGYSYDYKLDDKYKDKLKPIRPHGAGDGDKRFLLPKRPDLKKQKPLAAREKKYPDDVEELNMRALGDPEDALKNYDDDKFPWYRHRENKIRFARGLRQNQRWGTYTELTRSGDIRMLAEGLNKNVHPEIDEEKDDKDEAASKMAGEHNWGNVYVFARIEERRIAKGEWSFFRKRHKWGGRLENFDHEVSEKEENDKKDVRKWGQHRHRVQRTWQVLTRKDVEMGARDEARILSGKVDDPEFNEEGKWGRDDLKYGADFERYRHRLKWRNPDSKELADILVQSIRPKLDDFGDDPPLRGDSEGGDITVVTKPLEKDHAQIALESLAARNEAILQGYAKTRNHQDQGEGDKAIVYWAALAYRNKSNSTLEATAGTGDEEGNDATTAILAKTRKDNPLVQILAESGYKDVPGSNPRVSVEAKAKQDNAKIDLLSHTTQGENAEISATAKPSHGKADVSVEAQTPNAANIRISADGGDHGEVDIHATDDVSVVADKNQVTVTAGKKIILRAPEIQLVGHVTIVGHLDVTGHINHSKGGNCCA